MRCVFAYAHRCSASASCHAEAPFTCAFAGRSAARSNSICALILDTILVSIFVALISLLVLVVRVSLLVLVLLAVSICLISLLVPEQAHTPKELPPRS